MTTLGYYDEGAAALLATAELTVDQRVLDVATGTGEVALGAMETVEPAGRVVGVDLSVRRRHYLLYGG